MLLLILIEIWRRIVFLFYSPFTFLCKCNEMKLELSTNFQQIISCCKYEENTQCLIRQGRIKDCKTVILNLLETQLDNNKYLFKFLNEIFFHLIHN